MRILSMFAAVLCLAIAGCGGGIGKDSKVVLKADTLYYDRADVDGGGPKERRLDLGLKHRALLISTGTMAEVEQLDGKYAKVRLLTVQPGDAFMDGASGWVLRDEIAEPTRAELATYHEKLREIFEAKETNEKVEAKAKVDRDHKSDQDDIEQKMIAAKEAEDKSYTDMAIKYYKDVADRYPLSPEAKVAAERVKALGK